MLGPCSAVAPGVDRPLNVGGVSIVLVLLVHVNTLNNIVCPNVCAVYSSFLLPALSISLSNKQSLYTTSTQAYHISQLSSPFTPSSKHQSISCMTQHAARSTQHNMFHINEHLGAVF